MRAGWYWIFFRPCRITWTRWAKLTELEAALASPLTSRLALDRPAYRWYMIHSGEWLYHLEPSQRANPIGAMALRVLKGALRESKYGDYLTENAYAAFRRQEQLEGKLWLDEPYVEQVTREDGTHSARVHEAGPVADPRVYPMPDELAT